MKYNLHAEDYLGYHIEILQDDDHQESPRSDDNLGTMVCWHRRYTLGDEQPNETPREYMQSLLSSDKWKDIDSNYEYYDVWCKSLNEDEDQDVDTYLDGLDDGEIHTLFCRYYSILPLYLYDHSGITMSTSSSSCPWDSGQIGFIYVDHSKALKWFGEKELTREFYKKVVESLRSEVQIYDDFLTGNIFGYAVWKQDDELDDDDYKLGGNLESCWGFYPDHGQSVS